MLYFVFVYIILTTFVPCSLYAEPDFIKMSEDKERVLIYFNEVKKTATGEQRIVPQIAQVGGNYQNRCN